MNILGVFLKGAVERTREGTLGTFERLDLFVNNSDVSTEAVLNCKCSLALIAFERLGFFVKRCHVEFEGCFGSGRVSAQPTLERSNF